MAISSKIEEILYEITKNTGNISDALTLGIGDIDVPNSSIFELNNLSTTATTGFPYFGILETSPAGFAITYSLSTDQYNVIFGTATISYNGSQISILDSKIPIKKEWVKDYSAVGSGSSSYQYGITVGLPLSEAQKATQSFNTVVSTLSGSGSTLLYVQSTSIAESLGFPLDAVVGSNYIKFNGVTSDKTALLVDGNYYNGSAYGTLPSDVSANTPVKFIFYPRVKYLTGFPVSTVSEDPNVFAYFPPLPSSWLPVAKVLVEDPVNPKVTGTNNDAYIRTVIDMPTSTSDNPILGDANDVNEIVSSVNNAIDNLNIYRNDLSVANFVNAVSSYTASQTTETGYSFNKFWSLQPFRPTQYYTKGLSFSGLERFEFPNNFSRSFWNIKNQDTQHTFAVFRGDLVSYNSAVLGTANISTADLSAEVLSVSNYQSSLDLGTQIYGVSAVRNVSIDEYVETVPTYIKVINTNTTTTNYMVDLTWTGTGITNSLFYHIYKRPTLSSEVIEKRITQIDDIQYPPYNTLTPVTDNTTRKLYSYNAYKFTTNEDCYIGGLSLKLGYWYPNQTASTGTTGLCIGVYSDNANNPNTSGLLSDNVVLKYSDISEGTGTYTAKFNPGINITTGADYWIVIKKPTDFTTGSGTTDLYIRVDSAGSGSAKTSLTFDGSSTWTSTGGSAYYQMRGFLDDGNITGTSFKRGLKLTENIANTGRRLSVYVPPVDDITDATGLFFNGSSTAIAATTDKTTQNELIVDVTAKLGADGSEKTLSATIPKNTARDTRFLLGLDTDIFDRITNVIVSPGTDLTRIANGPILWSIYDLITVETEP